MDMPLTPPSAVQMYPEPNEQAKKLALFGVAGALANTIALASRIKPIDHSPLS